MDVSRLTIGQETISKLNAMAHITPKRKREIREEGVLEMIRSKHAGYEFKKKELIVAAGYRPGEGKSPDEKRAYWAGQSLLKRMQDKGKIKKLEKNSNRSAYIIPGDGVTIKSQNQILEEVAEQDKDINDIPEVDHILDDQADRTVEEPAAKEECERFNDKYTFNITVSKRGKEGEFGRNRVAELEMTDINIDTMRYMLNKLIDNVS